MKALIPLITFLFLSQGIFSQAKGGILHKDSRIDEMDRLLTESSSGKMAGYRVQLHFGAEKSKALSVKSKFLTQYPDIKAYDQFEAPYFRVRVGNFRTKMEAYCFWKSVADQFPGSFIVNEEIELPE